MLTTFYATLNPMLVLFICIIIGFTLGKLKLVPDNAATTVAKLETWVFCPALSFMTMAKYCTPNTIKEHAVNIVISTIFIALAMVIAIAIARVMIKKNAEERGIYTYALTFGNYGYMGDPLVQAILGDAMLAQYKLFCLPVSLLTYLWGVGLLIPKGKGKGGFLKSFFNPPTVAMLIGMLVGFLGISDSMPTFVTGTLSSLSACMGPLAMLLVGLTVSSYDVKKMLTNTKVYIATALRLIVLPILLVAIVIGLASAIELIFTIEISNSVFIFAFIAAATPLGLNTIVFPKAYGADSSTGASMAIISHTLSVVTIPLLYALLGLVLKAIG